jgi:hypothetical protein
VAQPLPVDVQPAIAQGLAFLEAQYNPDLGLLQESPDIGRSNYFLANDALLARQVLALYGEQELADSLAATLDRYGVNGNGFIEVIWGEPVQWPPLHFQDPGTLVTTAGDAQIMTIRHDGPGYFYDWSAYSNLAFMAAVNEWNQGHEETARRLYELEASTFDGHGFPDAAYWQRNGVYETLGLAWGVYAAGLMCIQPNEILLHSLLLRQDPQTGGFHTHFSTASERLADPNVETTAIALLALHAIRQADCKPPARLGFPAQ